jgi:hypothetical protein
MENHWNIRLVSKIADAFVRAVAKTKQKYPLSNLWYRWPLLLPLEPHPDKVFHDLSALIIRKISNSEVLEGVDGLSYRPSQLRSVPKLFRDEHGLPLLPNKCSNQNIICDKYPVETANRFQAIGVQPLSDKMFLDQLANFTSRFPDEFQALPETWHDEICGILIGIVETHRSTIDSLNIIPLRIPRSNDCRWVSSKFGLLFFSDETDGLLLPKSIGRVGHIHPGVIKSSNRGKLFAFLGAKSPNTDDLCKLIIENHEDLSISLIRLEVADMVEHFLFLYQAKWKPPVHKQPNFYCCAAPGAILKMYKVSEVYMPSDETYSASYVGKEAGLELVFLHPLYIDTFRQLYKGLEWLQVTMKVRTRIRLAYISTIWGYQLHSDFKLLLSRRPGIALELMRRHWPYYSEWFIKEIIEGHSSPNKDPDIPDSMDNDSRNVLLRAVSNVSIPCHGGHWGKLQETYLPTEGMLMLCNLSSLPLCDTQPPSCWVCRSIRGLFRRPSQDFVPSDRLLLVNQPDEVGWEFLAKFGVSVWPDVHLFLKHLRQVRGQRVSYRHMQLLYEYLDGFKAHRDVFLIRQGNF